MSEIERLLENRSIIVCCGSGGVGKTTIAAALGHGAASLGRRVCVLLTVDPARRLADALGVDDVASTVEAPHPIATKTSGQLFVASLDAERTFERLIRRHARDEVQSERILSNRLYRNLVSSLSGTHEYMATERLYELHEESDFDLIVVDTPPARHALDFLDAPGRLSGFLDNRVLGALIRPAEGSARAISAAARLVLRTIARIAGSEIVDDAVAFFQAFEGMEEGFRQRADHVRQLLREESTGFALVTTPKEDAINEAEFFAARLAESFHGADVLVVNRSHSAFLTESLPERGRPGSPWSALVENLEELGALAQTEAVVSQRLIELAQASIVATVPVFARDVHDLEGLGLVASYLLAF